MKLKDIKVYASCRDEEQNYFGLKYFIYEWLSTFLTKFLLYTPITANQTTIAGIIFVFIAAFFFGFGTIWFSLLAIGFIYLGELMDAVDGTLARCKKSCSRLQSNFLGNIYHSSAYPLLFLGIGVGVATNEGNFVYVLLGAIAALAQEVTAFLRFLKNTVMFKNKEWLNKEKPGLFSDPDESKLLKVKGWKKFIFTAFQFPLDHLRVIIILAFALTGIDQMTSFAFFNGFKWLVIFYSIFVPIKALGYFVSIYWSFKKIEIETSLKK
jgi:hypothetical protein